MKNLIIFHILIFTNCISYSQRLKPFTIINFNDLNPIWLSPVTNQVVKDSTLSVIYDEFNCIDGTTEIAPLVFNNNIFHVKDFGGGPAASGSLVECRVLNSGNLVWQKRYGLYEDNFQTAIRLIYFNNENKLVILAQRKRYKIGHPMNEANFQHMVLFEEIIDPANGEVLNSSNCDYSLLTYYPTTYSPYGGSTKAAFFIEKGNYRYYEYNVENGKNYIQSLLLNSCGEPMEDVKKVEISGIFDRTNIIEIGPDTILILTKEFFSNDSTFSFNFSYYTRDLVLLESHVSSTMKEHPGEQRIISLSKKRDKILIDWIRFIPGDSSPRPVSVGVFDIKGKLLKVNHMPKSFFPYFTVLEWEEDDNKMTILKAEQKRNGTNFQNYLVSTENNFSDNSIKVIKEYQVKDSLQLGVPIQIMEVSGNKWLITISQNEYYLKMNGSPASDNDGFATVLMLVDKDKFTQPVSSEDVVIEDEFAPIVFPNPGLDGLNISWQQSFTGQIDIINMQGQNVSAQTVKNINQKIIDTFTWPSGLYGIRIYDEIRKVVYRYKWVKK